MTVLPPEPAGGGSRFAGTTAEEFARPAACRPVAGPGMGTGDDAAELLRPVLRTDEPALVDADGLTAPAAHRHLLPREALT